MAGKSLESEMDGTRITESWVFTFTGTGYLRLWPPLTRIQTSGK
jgi:hypothetical protein